MTKDHARLVVINDYCNNHQYKAGGVGGRPKKIVARLRACTAPLDSSLVSLALARQYACGEITWPQIRESIEGVTFGDVLLALSAQGLTLPRLSAPKSAQQAAVNEGMDRRQQPRKSRETWQLLVVHGQHRSFD